MPQRECLSGNGFLMTMCFNQMHGPAFYIKGRPFGVSFIFDCTMRTNGPREKEFGRLVFFNLARGIFRNFISNLDYIFSLHISTRLFPFVFYLYIL